MSTPYSLPIDRFIKKLKNDKNFFNYTGLTDSQIEVLVKDHSIDLINQAIGMIYEFGNPDINFYDKDDDLEIFNEDLVKQEIDLLINIMYQKYLEEDKNKLKAFGLTFNTKELNVFSPANDRNSFLGMVDNIKSDNIGSISNYLSRNRKTWELKSLY